MTSTPSGRGTVHKPRRTSAGRTVPRQRALAAGHRSRPARPSRPVVTVGSRGRVTLLVVLLFISLGAFTGKLILVQVVRGPAMAEEAREQRLTEITVEGNRGEITDATGVVLASSVPRYDVSVDQLLIPGYSGDPEHGIDPGAPGAAEVLAPILGLDVAELGGKLVGTSQFRYIAKGVEPKAARQIASLGISGVYVQQVSARVYPNGSLAGDIIGFTNSRSVGLQGLESAFDAELQGSPGTEVYERGRTGQAIPGGYRSGEEAVDGQSIQLTIRSDIQWKAQDAIAQAARDTGAASGQIVVMRPNGEILALADDSTIDPNDPGAQAASALSSAVSDVFEPGSTGKVVTMAAALETGAVEATTPFTVPDTYTIGSQTFHDSHEHGAEHLTTTGILATSSNTGTVQVGALMSAQTEYEYLQRFGFGSKTGIEMPGESKGILHPAAEWDGRTRYTVLFGQGLAVTAVQAASVYATIANGGVRVEPRLIAGWTGSDGVFTPSAPAPSTQVVSTQTADEVRSMLESVVDDGTGTLAAVSGFQVAGKTGTAQNMASGGITASFIGFAPADDPQVVVAVILNDPKTSIYGGVVAAPVFADVTGYALTTLDVAPSGAEPTLFPATW